MAFSPAMLTGYATTHPSPGDDTASGKLAYESSPEGEPETTSVEELSKVSFEAHTSRFHSA